MSSFFTVLKFELMHYLRNKVYLVTTILLLLIVSIGLSVPTVIESFESEETAEEILVYGIVDTSKIIDDIDFLSERFSLGDLVMKDSIEQLEEDIESGVLAGGYIIESNKQYDYVLLNNEIRDRGINAFNHAFKARYQKEFFQERDLDYNTLEPVLFPSFDSEVKILGKDSARNYWYTYVLVFGLYMAVIMYGQLIATSVAAEKSNRTMELLVTSTKTNYLIFGKVISGAMAGIFQFAVIIATGKIAYNLNAAAWDGELDMIFDIPGEVLLNFSIFGILGFLLFAFIFGALGALVSKTEDVSASATPVNLIFIAAFMISIFGMMEPTSLLLKIASFIPFSSFLAMFVRISMGEVTSLEVFISLSLLALTTIGIGFLAARIYRMGTLMYGNPVKLKDIPKILKKQ